MATLNIARDSCSSELYRRTAIAGEACPTNRKGGARIVRLDCDGAIWIPHKPEPDLAALSASESRRGESLEAQLVGPHFDGLVVLGTLP